jgi:IS1 family transposase
LDKKNGGEVVWISQNTDTHTFEFDELFWFIKQRGGYEHGINTYLITMISRFPRQILAYDVGGTKTAAQMQRLAGSAPRAENYATDGNLTYLDVDFQGKHIRNTHSKSDTHNVESINADLRHYIRGLSRKSRCFFRTYETMRAVLSVFVDAYNKFGEAKLKYRKPVKHRSATPAKHLHKWRYPSFSLLDFL